MDHTTAAASSSKKRSWWQPFAIAAGTSANATDDADAARGVVAGAANDSIEVTRPSTKRSGWKCPLKRGDIILGFIFIAIMVAVVFPPLYT